MYKANNQSGNAILFIIIGIVVVAVVGYFVIVGNQNQPAENSADNLSDQMMQADQMKNDSINNDKPSEDNNQMMQADDNNINDNMIENDAMMDDDKINNNELQVGKYKDYSPSVYAAAVSAKRILFFHANWCPSCAAAHTEISSSLDKIPAGVVVFKTNYDTETELKKKYNITYQHTFVQVDAQGNEMTKWNGGGIDEIIANIL